MVETLDAKIPGGRNIFVVEVELCCEWRLPGWPAENYATHSNLRPQYKPRIWDRGALESGQISRNLLFDWCKSDEEFPSCSGEAVASLVEVRFSNLATWIGSRVATSPRSSWSKTGLDSSEIHNPCARNSSHCWCTLFQDLTIWTESSSFQLLLIRGTFWGYSSHIADCSCIRPHVLVSSLWLCEFETTRLPASDGAPSSNWNDSHFCLICALSVSLVGHHLTHIPKLHLDQEAK